MKKFFAFLGAILSALYLLSPVDALPELTLGPLGLLDDAAVIPILLACLKVLGFDASRLFGRKQTKAKDPDEEVIDID